MSGAQWSGTCAIMFKTNTTQNLAHAVTLPFNTNYPFQNKHFYEMDCLDEAKDLKAKISLQIREWDRHFTAGHDLDKGIPTSLMDDRSFDIFGNNFNQYEDHDLGQGNRYNNCLIDGGILNR